jgi:hypothetical protein
MLRRNSIGEEKLNTLYALPRKQGKRFAEAISAVVSNPGLLPGFGQSFVREVESIRQAVADAKTTVQSTTGLTDAIKEIANKHIASQDVRQKVIALFEHVINAYSVRDIIELLRSISVSLGDAEQEQQSNAVNIMTMHQAKGLTAQVVIVVGAEEAQDAARLALYLRLAEPKPLLSILLLRPGCASHEAKRQALGPERRRQSQDSSRTKRDKITTLHSELLSLSHVLNPLLRQEQGRQNLRFTPRRGAEGATRGPEWLYNCVAPPVGVMHGGLDVGVLCRRKVESLAAGVAEVVPPAGSTRLCPAPCAYSAARMLLLAGLSPGENQPRAMQGSRLLGGARRYRWPLLVGTTWQVAVPGGLFAAVGWCWAQGSCGQLPCG